MAGVVWEDHVEVGGNFGLEPILFVDDTIQLDMTSCFADMNLKILVDGFLHNEAILPTYPHGLGRRFSGNGNEVQAKEQEGGAAR
jgi:hypothetical protein